MNIRPARHPRRFELLCIVVATSSCKALGIDSSADESVAGRAEIAITAVPNGVACIRITVKGDTRSAASTFDVVPQQSSVLSMGGLPVGNGTFNGEAFASACSAIKNTDRPAWLSHPVNAIVTTGSPVQVTLQMFQNGQAGVGVNFPAVFDAALWDNATFG